MLGSGMPALELEGCPSRRSSGRRVALVLVYTAYVSEVYRAGIESVHPSQDAAARSLGLTPLPVAPLTSCIPQAVRRVIPPLLNDFIGLQKDTALVSVLGVVEVLEPGADQRGGGRSTARPTSSPRRSSSRSRSRSRASPTGSSRATAGGGRRRGWLRERADARVEDAAQVLRQARGAAGDRPRARRARGRLPDRRVRLGQVDAAPLRQPARADRRGPDRARAARRSPRAAST